MPHNGHELAPVDCHVHPPQGVDGQEIFWIPIAFAVDLGQPACLDDVLPCAFRSAAPVQLHRCSPRSTSGCLHLSSSTAGPFLLFPSLPIYPPLNDLPSGSSDVTARCSQPTDI